MKSIEIKAPAKINFGLNVINKRSDGFHNMETLFYPIHDLFDTLYLEKSDRFLLTCTDSSLPCDNTNLIVKTKNLLEKTTGRTINAAIHCEKRIPMGGGLGGGSSDSAAVLISLNELFELNIDKDTLAGIALQLGSDVPYFLNPKPAIGKSRGEILELIDFEIDYPILLVNPRINVSTKEAFKNIKPGLSHPNYRQLGGYVFSKAKEKLVDLKNDFEDYTLIEFPEIDEIKRKMIAYDAEFSMMTGTGSTVFGIFKNMESINSLMAELPDNYFSFISLPY